ncbi:MAG: multi-sensor hybrid histidine kinase [Phycisphaerales bacterium]|nr:multi-sensor hybrid histidine kinase [Phycisphaerales bacterium]
MQESPTPPPVVPTNAIPSGPTHLDCFESATNSAERRFLAFAKASSGVFYQMSADWTEMQPLDGRGLVASNDAPIRDWMERNIPQSEHAPIRERIAHSIQNKTVFELEHRVYRGDGTLGWTCSRAVPILDARGQITEWIGTATDITDRKHAEFVVRDSEAKFRQLADAMPQIVWAARPDGTLDYYNRRWFEYIGIAQEQAGGAAEWAQYVHPDDMDRVAAAWAVSLNTGDPYGLEFRVRDRHGVYCWFLVRAQAARNEAGAIVRWFGTCTDIEGRKRAGARDRLLIDLDDAVRPLTNAASITATYARLLGEHMGADRCAYADVETDQDTFNLTGDYNAEGVPSIVGRYSFTQFGREVLRLMRADEPYVVEDIDSHDPPPEDTTAYRATMIQAVICVPLHKDGRFVAAMAVHQRVRRQWLAEDVQLVRHVASRCWESIERARIERTLRQSEERLTFSVAAGDLGTFYCPMPLGHIVWNTKCKEHFWLPEHAEVDFDRFYAILHPDDRDRTRKAVEVAVFNREDYDIEYRTVSPQGQIRWVRAKGRAYYDSDSNPTRFDGVTLDITDRKLAEAERQTLLESERAARSDVEHASRMKDEFLATLSHELRTPLNAVLGWSQIMRQSDDPADLAQGLEVIERNARAQAQIIEDLLDMSRIISGKVRLDLQRLDLSAIVQAAVETARPTANAKGIRLRSVVDPPHGAQISGDVNRLQQVLWNLLTNAIKFTPKGGRVQVLLERVESHLEVSVVDTGEGIPVDFLPNVFDRFRQADASTTRKHGGLGLGLSIVKQLVELHGGSISVSSGGRGLGSTFTVSLPMLVIHGESETRASRRHPRSSPVSARVPDPSVNVEGIRVLVVDDEPDARALVKRLLEDRGAVATTAGSAEEALVLLREGQFDVLCSDVGMPENDGYELIRRVRALGKTCGGDIPAIALTAYARAEDRMKAVSAGFLMHVAKPVEPAELITMVAGAAGRTGHV